MALPTAGTAATLSDEIDQLLEHYLSLLDQYTTLRTQLSTSQSSIFQNISRANFTAERGIRYGADSYDARMQATRVCRITVPATKSSTTDASAAQQEQGRDAVQGQTLDDVERDTTDEVESLKEKERQDKNTTETAVDARHFAMAKRLTRWNSLKMFGLLTPPALKEAQRESVIVVEDLVMKIVAVDAEMKEVEIRIRRARKWKAKAEAREADTVEKMTQKFTSNVEVMV